MNSNSSFAKIRIHSRLWPVLAILLLVLQLLWPNRAWSTLLIIMAGSWLLSFFWTLSLARRLFMERQMRYGWAQVGDLLEERFSIINDSFLPALWLEVQDHSNLPGYTAGRITSIGGNQTMEWKTEGTCTRRGLFNLGPTTLRTGDPFGLCSMELLQPNATILLVLPPVLPLPAIEIAAGGRAGEGSRSRRAALETTVSVETIREYARRPTQGHPLAHLRPAGCIICAPVRTYAFFRLVDFPRSGTPGSGRQRFHIHRRTWRHPGSLAGQPRPA